MSTMDQPTQDISAYDENRDVNTNAPTGLEPSAMGSESDEVGMKKSVRSMYVKTANPKASSVNRQQAALAPPASKAKPKKRAKKAVAKAQQAGAGGAGTGRSNSNLQPVRIKVVDSKGGMAPVDNTEVTVTWGTSNALQSALLGVITDGMLDTDLAIGEGVYVVPFSKLKSQSFKGTEPKEDGRYLIVLKVDLEYSVRLYTFKSGMPKDPTNYVNLDLAPTVQIGQPLVAIAAAQGISASADLTFKWFVNDEEIRCNHQSCRIWPVGISSSSVATSIMVIDTSRYRNGIKCRAILHGPHTDIGFDAIAVLLPPDTATVQFDGTIISERSRSTAGQPQNDLALWVVIRRATEEVSYEYFQQYMDYTMYGKAFPTDLQAQATYDVEQQQADRVRYLPFMDSEAYRALKVSAEAFLKVNCAVLPSNYPSLPSEFINLVSRRIGTEVDISTVNRYWDEYRKQINGTQNRILPYLELIHQKIPDILTGGGPGTAPFNTQQLRDKLMYPCLIELIWSYWNEEGMLVQTMNAISRRFQNIPAPGDRDPLITLETDPLRPLNNLLWGYIQDEQHRLTVARRSYEYDHHYGITLYGKAVPKQRGADTRSRFLEAYHNLLFLCTQFFQQDDDTNFISDGFPVLNALKEIHLILTQGSHNQFGDLPATARTEMLMQQWLLARPEFREFLPTRVMVALPEPWMDRVDAMKSLQGWTDVSVLHFRNLAKYGEQLLLSIRYGAWSTIDDADVGKHWARFWRSEIQGYIHAYRAVTGADLTREPVDCTPPSELLRQRMAAPRLAA